MSEEKKYTPLDAKALAEAVTKASSQSLDERLAEFKKSAAIRMEQEYWTAHFENQFGLIFKAQLEKESEVLEEKRRENGKKLQALKEKLKPTKREEREAWKQEIADVAALSKDLSTKILKKQEEINKVISAMGQYIEKTKWNKERLEFLLNGFEAKSIE